VAGSATGLARKTTAHRHASARAAALRAQLDYVCVQASHRVLIRLVRLHQVCLPRLMPPQPVRQAQQRLPAPDVDAPVAARDDLRMRVLCT
jgi:hypothetical protein